MHTLSVAFVSKQLSRNPMNGVAVYNAGIISGLRGNNVNVCEIWPKAGLCGILPVYTFLSFHETMQLFKKNRVNIIHSTMCDNVLLSIPREFPFVLTIHGTLADEIRLADGFSNALSEKRFDRLIIFKSLIEAEKISAKKADKIICPSEYSKQKIVHYYSVPPRKVEVIPHGINLCEFDNQYPSIITKRRSIIILFVGRLTYRKGLFYLLKAVQILRKRFPVELRIVGNGQERAFLQEYCAKAEVNYANFLGDLSRSEVVKEFVNCDIFCLPSLHEGFGIVLLEAMAAKKPVVATCVGGIPEVIQTNKTGILVPPRDEKALASAIERLILDKKLRFEMGARGYEKAVSCDWNKASQKLVRIYESIL